MYDTVTENPVVSRACFHRKQCTYCKQCEFSDSRCNPQYAKQPPGIFEGGYRFAEKKGKIIIGDNVFVGAKSTIIYDVTIGSNVIIGAGSVVTKDIPDGCVAAGVPCKVIGNFEDFVEKRKSIN